MRNGLKEFADDTPVVKRIGQRDIMPSAIKNRHFAQDNIKDSELEVITQIGLATGTIMTVTSVIETAQNPLIRIGVLPFMIAFYEGSLNTGNLIPSGSNLATNDYRIEQVVMPQVDPGGHDGSNVVIKTSLTNNTGSPQDIVIVTQSRFIIGGGGLA